MTTESKNKANGNQGKRSLAGVVQLANQTQLPGEFLKIGKDFEEALGRCVIRDDYQKNCIILYKAQLELFGMYSEIQDLTNWLNASGAVGGFNRSLAAMTYTGIYLAEGAGIKLGKDQQKALHELNSLKLQRHGEDKGNINGDSP